MWDLIVSVPDHCLSFYLGSLPRNSVFRLTDRLDMTIVAEWDVKPQIKLTIFQLT